MVQAPENSQNLNRYSYVLNNPLSYTDPSGYFFKAIGKFFKRHGRALAAIGISVATAGVVSGLTFWARLTTSVGGGALAGYVSTGTLKGALIGAFSAAAFYGVGEYFQGIAHQNGVAAFEAARDAGYSNFAQAVSYVQNATLTTAQQVGKLITLEAAGGITSTLSGGQFGHGFIGAGVTQAFVGTISNIGEGSSHFNARVARAAVAAIVRGTSSELSGGKFANGAITNAFSYAAGDRSRSNQSESGQGIASDVLNATLDIAGKVFALPNTVLGGIIGLAGIPFGATVTFGDNAIVFNNFPFGPGGALTLGNVILSTGPTLNQIVPTYAASEAYSRSGKQPLDSELVGLGTHERAHTLQAQRLGPFFLPVYFISGALNGGIISGNNPFEAQADEYALKERGY
ncbi:MAG: hypothetical protein Tsb002_08240 [Wenzhouxiangellaceae bacterium]